MARKNKRAAQTTDYRQAQISGVLHGSSNTEAPGGVNHVRDKGFSKGQTAGIRTGEDVIKGK